MVLHGENQIGELGRGTTGRSARSSAMSANASATGNGEPYWPRATRLEIQPRAKARAAPLSGENIALALSEHNSRVVLASCVDAPRSVKDITIATGLPLATAYRQVHRLLDLGVLIVERSAMTPEGKKYDLFRSRIAEGHLDMAQGREAVTWVENEATEGRLSGLWDAVRSQARPL